MRPRGSAADRTITSSRTRKDDRLKLYDVVELRESRPSEQLSAGAVGSVVDVFDGPRPCSKSSLPMPVAAPSPWSRFGPTRWCRAMATFDEWQTAYDVVYRALPAASDLACPNCGQRTLGWSSQHCPQTMPGTSRSGVTPAWKGSTCVERRFQTESPSDRWTSRSRNATLAFLTTVS